jgi:hypothetical protein
VDPTKPILASGNDTISVLQLKRLLHELKDSKSTTLVRPRLLGQMWQPAFLKIFVVTENGVVFLDPLTNKTKIISNLADVVQFELDSRYQIYHPYFHYKISTLKL